MFKVSPEIPVDEWVLVVEWSEEFAEIWAAFRQCDTTLNHPTDNGYQTDVIFSDPASLGSSAYSQCLLADENVGSSELKLLNCLIRAKNHLDASSSNSSEDDAKCLSVPATPFAGTCSDSEISVSSDSVSSPLHKHDFLVSVSNFKIPNPVDTKYNVEIIKATFN
jgi:hypothetical protein